MYRRIEILKGKKGDVGCGWGLLADELYRQGFKNIELIDIEDQRQDVFKEVKQMSFYFVNLNFDKLPFEDGAIDLVVSTSVFEHLENHYHYLREICRVLKPAGKLILTMPNCWNIISRLLFLKNGMIEGVRGTNNHINPITKDIWQFMISRLFKEKSRFYMHRPRIGIKYIDWLKIKYPKTEFWSPKVGYLLEKI